MERLEERVVLSTSTWTGDAAIAKGNNNWSDAGNWDTLPTTGSNLVFPAGLSGAALTSTDDIAGGSFGTVTIEGGGYAINAASGVTLTLSGAVDASQTSGSSSLNPPIAFGANPAAVTVDNQAAALAMGGAVSGTAGLTKQGAGVLDLKATNTYTGTTTVSAGALLVDGTVGAVSVASGATLGGVGTVGPITTTSGTISPGDSSTLTGVLTSTGSLALDSASSLDVTINGGTVGTNYDQLVAGGAGGSVNLANATLHVALGAFNPTINQQFTILHNTSGSAIVGTFKGLAEGATLAANGHDFAISYKGGTDNQDVVLTAVNPPTIIWSGSDASAATPNNNWSDANNWVGKVAPVAGDSLTFPTGLTGAALTSNNDIPDTVFNSIAVQASGYVIQGVGVGLAGSIDASQSTGTATLGLPITFNPEAGTVTVDNSGATLLLTNTLAAANGVTKQGQGTLSLAADSGSLAAVVDAGTLQDDGTVGVVSVNAGATLSGTGTVGGIATTRGTVSPGHTGTTGILTDAGNLVLDPNSTFAATLNGATTAGTDYDQAVVSGSGHTVNLAGATLSVTAGANFPTQGGQQLTILHNTTGSAVLGTFAGLAEGATLAASNHSFSITYKGGSSHQDVVLTSLISTTTAVSPVTTSLVSGQSVALTATVTPASGTGTPTGSVTFKNGSTSLGTATLTGGKATLTTTQLTAGTDAITATYSGDTAYGTSTSASQSVTVGQSGSSTKVSISPNPSINGQPVTLTAVVSPAAPGTGTPTGSVTFKNGSTSLGTVNLASGVGVLLTTSLPTGTDAITASYAGDTNFIASTSTPVNAVVNQGGASVSLTTSNSNPFALVPITLTAIVSAATGTGTPTGSVTFQTANGTSLGTVPLTSGTATLTTNTIPVGAQAITAVYSGDTAFARTTSAPLSVVIGHANDVYVNQIYQDVFGVPADLGATYWIALLNAQYPDRQVARLILQSPPAKRAVVQAVFEMTLGRQATAAELNRALASGSTSTTPLYVRIFGSNEYYTTRGHGTNQGFLTALATDWFGAPFAPARQAQLLGELARGTSRSKVARQVITSPAGVRSQVNSIVEGVLRRPATPAELRRYTPLVSQGDLIGVYTDLFSSRAFKATLP